MRAGGDASEHATALGLWLLRHLRDARALRRHPLTARFFAADAGDRAGLDALHVLVRAALPAGSRALRIVEACDLGDLPHKQAWSRMGLSPRTFYRERAAAAAAVAGALERVPAAVASRASQLDADLEAWHDLQGAGFSETVLTCSADALGAHMRPAVRARLHALRASAFASVGTGDDFGRELAAAERFAGQHPLARAEVCAARADAHCVRGEIATAIELRRDAVELSGDERVLASGPGLRAHVRHLRYLGSWHVDMDDARGGLALLERAQALVLAHDPYLPAVLAQLKEEIGCAALCIPDRAPGAGEAIEEARTLAARHGLTARLAWTEVIAAWTKAPLSAAEALGYARRGVELAEASLAGEWLARLLMTASRVYRRHGDAATALALTERARTHIRPGQYLHAFVTMRRAQALVAAGAHGDAAELAETARARIAAVNRSHYLGAAHATQAEALRGLGDTALAAQHIVAAIPLLENSGFAVELADANQLAASLTGDRAYRRRAHELARMLRAS